MKLELLFSYYANLGEGLDVEVEGGGAHDHQPGDPSAAAPLELERLKAAGGS